METAVSILERNKSDLEQELEKLQLRVRELRSSIKSIDQALDALGNRASGEDSSGQTLKDFVIGVLETQDVGLTAHDISDSIALSGRTTTPQSVSSTLSRLKGEGRVISQERGKWELLRNIAPSSGEDDAISMGLRDGSRDQPGTPEGSIPSSSTTRPHEDEDDDDLDF